MPSKPLVLKRITNKIQIARDEQRKNSDLFWYFMCNKGKLGAQAVHELS